MVELFNKSGCESAKEQDLYIDTVLAASAVNEDFFNEINKLAPFGSANREPRFIIENVSIIKSLILKDIHIKAICKTSSNTNINVICFNTVSWRYPLHQLIRIQKKIACTRSPQRVGFY